MKRILILLAIILLSTGAFALANDSSLLAHYKMDDLTDSSGNGNTLTNNGATASSSNCHDGDCFYFVTNDWMDTGFTGNDVTMTLSTWSMKNSTAFGDMFSQYDSSAFGGYAMFSDASDKFFAYSGIGSDKNILSPNVTALGVMLHYVLTYDGTTQRIYENGLEVNNALGPANYANPNNWMIGATETSTNNWHGTIDEVSLWDRTLNATEVFNLFINGVEYAGGGGGGNNTVSIDATYPGNNTQFNTLSLPTNVTFTATNTTANHNITIYVDGSIQEHQDNVVCGSGTCTSTFNVTYGASEEGQHNIYYTVENQNDPAGIQTSNTSYYYIDNVDPTINMIRPASGVLIGPNLRYPNSYFDNFTLDIRLTDDSLFSYFWNITFPNGTVIQHDNNTGLNGSTSYNITTLIDVSSFSTGSYDFDFISYDGHTKKAIKSLLTGIDLTSKEFDYSGIKIYDVSKSDIVILWDEKHVDRHKFGFQYAAPVKKRTYVVQAVNKITILSGTKWAAHLVADDGYWIDFEHDDLDRSKIKVKRLDERTVEVTIHFKNDQTMVKFNSIGVLNSASTSTQFYVGNYTQNTVSSILPGQSADFYLNVTFNSTYATNTPAVNASFYWNGTRYGVSYSNDSTMYYYNSTITLPLYNPVSGTDWNYTSSINITATNSASRGIAYNGSHYGICELTGADNLQFYTNNFTFVSEKSISGQIDSCTDVEWNGTRWFVLDNGDDEIYSYNVTGEDPVLEADLTAYDSNTKGIHWDGTFWYSVGTADDAVDKFDAAWLNLRTDSISSQCLGAQDIIVIDSALYLLCNSGSSDEIYQYTGNWVYTGTQFAPSGPVGSWSSYSMYHNDSTFFIVGDDSSSDSFVDFHQRAVVDTFDYYWTWNYYSSQNYTTVVQTQTVSAFTVFNLTFFDEITQVQLTQDIDVEFISNNNTYGFTASSGLLEASVLLGYNYTIRFDSSGYGRQRQYLISLTNETRDTLKLYLLNNTVSTDLKVTIFDGLSLQRLPDQIVYLQRYRLGTNSYETVAMYTTDQNGDAYFDIESQNELYLFRVDNPWLTILETTVPAYIESSVLNIYLDTTDSIGEHEFSAGSITNTITFDKSTNSFTAVFNDAQAISTEICFKITQHGRYADTTINSTCTSAKSGTITLGGVTGLDQTYQAVLTAQINPLKIIGTGFFSTGNVTIAGGAYGLLLTAIIYIIFVFLVPSHMFAAIFGGVGLVFAKLMGIFEVSWGAVIIIPVMAFIIAIIMDQKK